MSAFTDIEKRLAAGGKILLCGAMGTEIQRRGIRTGLPLWSATALLQQPGIVKEIHRDYIDAGAEILSTNTFRTNIRTFQKAGIPEKAKEMTLLACSLARNAREESGRSDVAIGGEIAPVEDCFRSDLVPPDNELEREHATLAEWLAEGNVDFIFIETMNTAREAYIASVAAKKTGLPFMVSFVCSPDGTILSGERLSAAISKIMPLGPAAFLTNCRPLKTIETSVGELIRESPIPVGVYANGDGEPHDDQGWIFHEENPEKNYLEHARGWLERGVSIVGGCCGTMPSYIKALRELLDSGENI